MRVGTDTFEPFELAELKLGQEQQLTNAVIIRRRTVTANGLGSQSGSFSDLATCDGSLSRSWRYLERPEGGGLRAVSLWKGLVPVGTDLSPDDRICPGWIWELSLGVPTAGTFTLSFNGQTTAPISYAATGVQVAAAFGALATVGATNVAASGGAGGPYTFTFLRDLKATVLPITGNGAGLTGGALLLARPEYEVTDTDLGLSEATVLTAQLVRVRS